MVTKETQIKTIITSALAGYTICGSLDAPVLAPSVLIEELDSPTSGAYTLDKVYSLTIRAESEDALETAVNTLLKLHSRHPDGYASDGTTVTTSTITLNDWTWYSLPTLGESAGVFSIYDLYPAVVGEDLPYLGLSLQGNEDRFFLFMRFKCTPAFTANTVTNVKFSIKSAWQVDELHDPELLGFDLWTSVDLVPWFIGGVKGNGLATDVYDGEIAESIENASELTAMHVKITFDLGDTATFTEWDESGDSIQDLINDMISGEWDGEYLTITLSHFLDGNGVNVYGSLLFVDPSTATLSFDGAVSTTNYPYSLETVANSPPMNSPNMHEQTIKLRARWTNP